MKNHIKNILLLVLFFSSILMAQNADSLKIEPLEEVSNDSSFVMQKSPMGAFWRSAVLPGWGQFYNESYLKIPIIWGVSAWLLYSWNVQNDKYYYYRDLYNKSLETDDGLTDAYKNARDFYRDDRDLFAIYLGLTYFLNLIDAYVDAHLFDFDVQMNPMTNKPELQIKFGL